MAGKTRQQLINEINGLCEHYGCNENIRKLHFAQYVDRRLNPHPPESFVKWWTKHPDFKEGIGAVRAYNCQRYQDEFREARKYGLENEPPSAFQKVKTAMQ